MMQELMFQKGESDVSMLSKPCVIDLASEFLKVSA